MGRFAADVGKEGNMIRSVAIAATVSSVLLSPVPAAAASAGCGPHTEIVKELESRFEERQKGIGLASNGAVIEIFTSTTGSWTILMSFPNGQSCMMADGEGWESVPVTPAGLTV